MHIIIHISGSFLEIDVKPPKAQLLYWSMWSSRNPRDGTIFPFLSYYLIEMKCTELQQERFGTNFLGKQPWKMCNNRVSKLRKGEGDSI
jgi:hypothetical protein